MGTGYVSNSHSGGSLTANVPIRIDPLKHVSNVCLFVLLVASKSGEYRGAHQHALTPSVKVKQATPRQARQHLSSAACCQAPPDKVRCKSSIAVESGTKHGCTAVLTRTGSNSNPPFCKGFGREGKRREPQTNVEVQRCRGALEPKWTRRITKSLLL